jgi:hypothetical protein
VWRWSAVLAGAGTWRWYHVICLAAGQGAAYVCAREWTFEFSLVQDSVVLEAVKHMLTQVLVQCAFEWLSNFNRIMELLNFAARDPLVVPKFCWFCSVNPTAKQSSKIRWYLVRISSFHLATQPKMNLFATSASRVASICIAFVNRCNRNLFAACTLQHYVQDDAYFTLFFPLFDCSYCLQFALWHMT